MNSLKRTVMTVVGLLLFAVTGLVAEGVRELQPKVSAVTVQQEEAPAAHPLATSTPTGEEIKWQVISSGGTDGSSTNFRLAGTVGQTAVGVGTSDNFILSCGYWQHFGGAPGCCNHDGMRGDINYDLAGPNIVDLTYLVAHLFGGGAPPPCPEEGDVNGDGSVNIVDLTHLVAHLFSGGAPPEPCP